MERRNRWKRWIAMFLAVSMVFTSQSMTTLAGTVIGGVSGGTPSDEEAHNDEGTVPPTDGGDETDAPAAAPAVTMTETAEANLSAAGTDGLIRYTLTVTRTDADAVEDARVMLSDSIEGGTFFAVPVEGQEASDSDILLEVVRNNAASYVTVKNAAGAGEFKDAAIDLSGMQQGEQLTISYFVKPAAAAGTVVSRPQLSGSAGQVLAASEGQPVSYSSADGNTDSQESEANVTGESEPQAEIKTTEAVETESGNEAEAKTTEAVESEAEAKTTEAVESESGTEAKATEAVESEAETEAETLEAVESESESETGLEETTEPAETEIESETETEAETLEAAETENETGLEETTEPAETEIESEAETEAETLEAAETEIESETEISVTLESETEAETIVEEETDNGEEETEPETSADAEEESESETETYGFMTMGLKIPSPIAAGQEPFTMTKKAEAAEDGGTALIKYTLTIKRNSSDQISALENAIIDDVVENKKGTFYAVSSDGKAPGNGGIFLEYELKKADGISESDKILVDNVDGESSFGFGAKIGQQLQEMKVGDTLTVSYYVKPGGTDKVENTATLKVNNNSISNVALAEPFFPGTEPETKPSITVTKAIKENSIEYDENGLPKTMDYTITIVPGENGWNDIDSLKIEDILTSVNPRGVKHVGATTVTGWALKADANTVTVVQETIKPDDNDATTSIWAFTLEKQPGANNDTPIVITYTVTFADAIWRLDDESSHNSDYILKNTANVIAMEGDAEVCSAKSDEINWHPTANGNNNTWLKKSASELENGIINYTLDVQNVLGSTLNGWTVRDTLDENQFYANDGAKLEAGQKLTVTVNETPVEVTIQQNEDGIYFWEYTFDATVTEPAKLSYQAILSEGLTAGSHEISNTAKLDLLNADGSSRLNRAAEVMTTTKVDVNEQAGFTVEKSEATPEYGDPGFATGFTYTVKIKANANSTPMNSFRLEDVAKAVGIHVNSITDVSAKVGETSWVVSPETASGGNYNYIISATDGEFLEADQTLTVTYTVNANGWTADNFNDVSVDNTATVSYGEGDARITHEASAPTWKPDPVENNKWIEKTGKLTIKNTLEVKGSSETAGDDQIQVAEYTLKVEPGTNTLKNWRISDTFESTPTDGEKRDLFGKTDDYVTLYITPVIDGKPQEGEKREVEAVRTEDGWSYIFDGFYDEHNYDYLLVTYYADAAPCADPEKSATLTNTATLDYVRPSSDAENFGGSWTTETVTLSTPYSTQGPNVYDLSSDYSSWLTNSNVSVWDKENDEWVGLVSGHAEDYKDENGHWDPEKVGELFSASPEEAMKFEADFTIPGGTNLKPGDKLTYQFPPNTDFGGQSFTVDFGEGKDTWEGTIDENGKLTLTVPDGYNSGDGNALKGHFYVQGDMDASNKDKDHVEEFEFPGMDDVVVHVIPDEGQTKVGYEVNKYLNLGKDGSAPLSNGTIDDLVVAKPEPDEDGNIEGLVEEIYYYIKVKANGDNSEKIYSLDFTDTISNGLEFIPGSITFVDAEGKELIDDKAEAYEAALNAGGVEVGEDGSLHFSMEWPEQQAKDAEGNKLVDENGNPVMEQTGLDKDEEIYIRYKVRIPKEFWSEHISSVNGSGEVTMNTDFSASNNVEVKANGQYDGNANATWSTTKDFFSKKGKLKAIKNPNANQPGEPEYITVVEYEIDVRLWSSTGSLNGWKLEDYLHVEDENGNTLADDELFEILNSIKVYQYDPASDDPDNESNLVGEADPKLDKDGKIKGWTLKLDHIKPGKNVFIVYSVRYNGNVVDGKNMGPDSEMQKLLNSVKLYGPEGEGIGESGEVGVYTTAYTLDKRCDNNVSDKATDWTKGFGTITWTTEIGTAESYSEIEEYSKFIPAHSFYTDYLSSSQNTTMDGSYSAQMAKENAGEAVGARHVFPVSGANAGEMAKAIGLTLVDGNERKLEYGADYTVTFGTKSENTENTSDETTDDTIDWFQIEFLRDPAKGADGEITGIKAPVTITYNTEATPPTSGFDSYYFQNKGTFTYGRSSMSDEANHPYNVSDYLQKGTEGNVDMTNGEMIWKLTVNGTPGLYEWPDEYVIDEYIPEGQEFVSIYYGKNIELEENDGDGAGYKIIPSEEGNTDTHVQITIPKKLAKAIAGPSEEPDDNRAKTFVLYVKTKMTETRREEILQANGEAIPFTNAAQLTIGDKKLPKVNASRDVSEKSLKKSLTRRDDNTLVVSYTVDVNPDGILLGKLDAEGNVIGSETITFTDTISWPLQFINDSVKVYTKAEDGSDIYTELTEGLTKTIGEPAAEMDATQKMTIEGLPNKTALRITYEAKIVKTDGTPYSDAMNDVNIHVGGMDIGEHNEEDDLRTRDAGGDVEGAVSFILKKASNTTKEDPKTANSATLTADFMLWRFDGKGKTDTDEEGWTKIGSVKAGSRIVRVKPDTLYRLDETVPRGYEGYNKAGNPSESYYVIVTEKEKDSDEVQALINGAGLAKIDDKHLMVIPPRESGAVEAHDWVIGNEPMKTEVKLSGQKITEGGLPKDGYEFEVFKLTRSEESENSYYISSAGITGESDNNGTILFSKGTEQGAAEITLAEYSFEDLMKPSVGGGTRASKYVDIQKDGVITREFRYIVREKHHEGTIPLPDGGTITGDDYNNLRAEGRDVEITVTLTWDPNAESPENMLTAWVKTSQGSSTSTTGSGAGSENKIKGEVTVSFTNAPLQQTSHSFNVRKFIEGIVPRQIHTNQTFTFILKPRKASVSVESEDGEFTSGTRDQEYSNLEGIPSYLDSELKEEFTVENSNSLTAEIKSKEIRDSNQNYSNPHLLHKDGVPNDGEIYFDEEGEYYYSLEETITCEDDQGGYVATSTNYDITVYVGLVEGTTGKELKVYKVKYTYKNGEEQETTKELTGSDITVTDLSTSCTLPYYNTFYGTQVEIPVQKKVTGAKMREDMTFTFQLTSESITGSKNGYWSYNQGQYSDQFVNNNSKTVKITINNTDSSLGANKEGEKDRDIPVEGRFPTLYFKDVGTYTYKLKETTTNGNGFVVDTSEYTVTVEVTTGTDGKLTREVTYQKVGSDEQATGATVVFDNTYHVKGTEYRIPVGKILTWDEDAPIPEDHRSLRYKFTLEKTGWPGYGENGYEGDYKEKPTDSDDSADYENQEPKLPHFDKDEIEITLTYNPETGKYEISGETVFNPIYYNAAGTYTYKLTENDFAKGEDENSYRGYEKDETTYIVKVVVVDTGEIDNTNNLSILKVQTVTWGKETGEENTIRRNCVDISPASTPTFTNEYYPYAVGIKIPVKKDFTGYPAKEGVNNWTTPKTFTFELKPKKGEEEHSTDANGTEVATEVYGYKTYDRTSKTASDPIAKEDSLTTALTNWSSENQLAYFGTIYFNQPGTYTYTLTEKAWEGNPDADGRINGYLRDTKTYTITVTVEDKKGQLTATVEKSSTTTEGDTETTVTGTVNPTTGNNAPTFTNDYEAEPTTADVEATKMITVAKEVNKTVLANKTFTFTLMAMLGEEPCYKAVTTEGTDTVAKGEKFTSNSQTVTVNADGNVPNVKFPKLFFDKEGTYTFTLKEEKGDASGFTYDSKVYTVTITVTDDKAGHLNASVAYSLNGASAAAVDFTNHYRPTDTSLPIKVTKNIAGFDKSKVQKTFKFVLYSTGEDYDTGSEEAKSLQTIELKYNSVYKTEADFTDLTYSTDEGQNGIGTYYYVVKETDVPTGYTNENDKTYQIKVEITDDGSGQLHRKVTLDEEVIIDDSENSFGSVDLVTAAFKNTYNATGTAEIEGTKTLTGRKMKEGEFTFEVVKKGNAEDGSEDVVVGSGTNDANGHFTVEFVKDKEDGENVQFDENDIGKSFTKGEYYLREQKGGTTENGITYDKKTFNVNVTVEDGPENDGHLDVKASVEGGASFTNTYHAEGFGEVTGTKKLIGRELKDNQFTFEVKDEQGNVVGFAKNAGESFTIAGFGKAGSLSVLPFEVPFTEEDLDDNGKATFHYTLSEVKGSLPGVTYDETVYHLTVEVSDNGDGTLDVEVEVEVDEGYAVFENTYNTSAKTGVEVTKVLDGLDMTGANLFTFNLEKLIAGEVDDKYTSWETISSVENDPETGKVRFNNAIEITLDDLKVDEQNTADSYPDKTFTYRVREVKPANADEAMIYDEHIYEFTVTAHYDFATGELTLENNEPEEGKTFTNRWTAETSVPLIGFKTQKNLKLTAGKYEFRVYEKGKAYVDDGKIFATADPVLSATNEESGVINFGSLEYDLDDIRVMKDGKATYPEITKFEYEVFELKGTDKGITYDPSVQTVVVNVTYDSATGKLKAEMGSGTELLAFVNEYDTEAQTGFEAAKEMHGRALTEEDVEAFTFTLTADDEAYADTVKISTAKMTGTDGKIEGFKEGAIEVTLDDMADVLEEPRADGIYMKKFSYTLTESGERPGVTNDPNEKHLTVTATYDKNSGKLELMMTTWDNLTFINTYDTSAKTGVEVTKVLDGLNMTGANLFTFNLEKLIGESKDGRFTSWETISSEKNNPATGKVMFNDAIEITLDDLKVDEQNTVNSYPNKMFTYRVREVKPANADEAMIYDEHAYEFTVTAHYDFATGELTLENNEPEEGKTFTNRWTAETSVPLIGFKTQKDLKLTAGKYTFEVYKEEDVETAADGTVTVMEGAEPVLSAKNEESGAIYFGSLEYDLDDIREEDGSYPEATTFTYKVLEVEGDAEGITYDKSVKTVVVRVTYDMGTGELKAAMSDGTELLAFVNEYDTEAQTGFEAAKEMHGRALTAEDVEAFTFTLTADDEAYADTVKTKTAQMNAAGRIEGFKEGAIEVTLDDMADVLAEPKADGIYTKAFEYTLSESGTRPGVTNDPNEKHLTVTATYDKNNGELKLMMTRWDNLMFINTYEAEGSLMLDAQKTLTGRTLANEQFSFTLTQVDENGEALTGDAAYSETVKNAADGTVTFGTLAYTEEDAGNTYYYEVTETNAGAPGYEYDDSVYTVTVEVTDNDDGTLTNEPVITLNGGPVEEIAFANTYTAEGSVVLQAEKVLTGRNMSAGEFTFEVHSVMTGADGADVIAEEVLTVRDAEGNLIPVRATNTAAANGEAGTVTFPVIPYTQEDVGTHRYAIVEHAPQEDAGGIVYDREPVFVNVTVTDNGDSTLTAAAVLDGVHQIFENTYLADGTFVLEANKTLTGNRAQQIGAQEFRFVLEEAVTGADGTTTYTEAASGATEAGGHIRFDAVRYEIPEDADDAQRAEVLGTHTYRVREVIAPADANANVSITYSTQEFTVTTEVADNGDGTLTVTPAYPEGGVVFTNAYTATGSYVINNVQKTLANAALAAGQFSFELRDAQGNVLQTKTNAADGSVAFDALNYTQVDIGRDFTYTVAEVNAGAAGITYDTSVYTVTVHVADAGNGALNVTAQTTLNGQAVETMAFANSFAGSVTLAKTSTNGNALPGAQFQLYAHGNGENDWYIYNAMYADGTYTTGVDGTLTVENLPANQYYFIETQAPVGHVISTNADGTPVQYPFTIAPDGSGTAGAQANVQLAVVNQPSAVDTTLMVTKQLTYQGELWTATEDTFYVALFADEALTDRITDIQPVVFQNQSASTVEFTGLEYGRTYYLGEVNAEGTVLNDIGGVTANGEMFQPQFNDGNSAVITEGGGTQTIFFQNDFTTVPQGYYREGQLTITKQLLGADGVALNSNETFYAGIFSDEAYTTLADNVSANIVALNLNGRDTASDTVAVTIAPDETVTLYVTEVDENGVPVENSASFRYDVTVEGAVVTLEQDGSAQVVITNTAQEEQEEIETEAEETEGIEENGGTVEGGGSDTTTVKAGTSSVKTGDETPLGLYIGLMAAAAAILLILFLMRRRKRGEQ